MITKNGRPIYGVALTDFAKDGRVRVTNGTLTANGYSVVGVSRSSQFGWWLTLDQLDEDSRRRVAQALSLKA